MAFLTPLQSLRNPGSKEKFLTASLRRDFFNVRDHFVGVFLFVDAETTISNGSADE